MRELLERRVLGAIRWRDAVSDNVINLPLEVSSGTATFTRNLSGLFVITAANGLEKYTATFDLNSLAAPDAKPDESIAVTGVVRDPSGRYLPRSFTVKLPRPATKTVAQSVAPLLTPLDISLLPAPQAQMRIGCASVRVTVRTAAGSALPNMLVQILASGDNRILGRGMSDPRGEALVAIPRLPLVAAGLTPGQLATTTTEAKAKFIFPPADGKTPVDWNALELNPPGKVITDGTVLALKAGETISLNFSAPP